MWGDQATVETLDEVSLGCQRRPLAMLLWSLGASFDQFQNYQRVAITLRR